MRFEYTADEVLVIVTSDGKLYMIRPKEELNPIIKDLSSYLDGGAIEGAKVYENSLFILTSKKKVLYISELNDIQPEIMCDKYSGKLCGRLITVLCR